MTNMSARLTIVWLAASLLASGTAYAAYGDWVNGQGIAGRGNIRNDGVQMVNNQPEQRYAYIYVYNGHNPTLRQYANFLHVTELRVRPAHEQGVPTEERDHTHVTYAPNDQVNSIAVQRLYYYGNHTGNQWGYARVGQGPATFISENNFVTLFGQNIRNVLLMAWHDRHS